MKTSEEINLLKAKLERANRNILSITELMEEMYIELMTVKQGNNQYTCYTS